MKRLISLVCEQMLGLRSSTNAARISARLSPVIEAVATRIHYAEGRRANYTLISGAFIAAGVAVLTFASGSIPIYFVRTSANFAAVVAIFTGLSTLLLYSVQINRYPFTSATNTWKWFYRDALPSSKKFHLKWISYLPKSPCIGGVRKAYSDQIDSFKSKMYKINNDNVNLDQDLEQLYVLHVTELYKNLQLKHISLVFRIGIYSMILSSFIGGGYGLYSEQKYKELKYYSVLSDDGVSINSEVYSISHITDLEPTFVATFKARNYGDKNMDWLNVTAQDSRGGPIPAQFSYPYGVPGRLNVGSEETVVVHIMMQKHFSKQIEKFVVDLK